jgi:uncharacterized membrane protein
MARLLIAYVFAIATFGVVDLSWIVLIAEPMYRAALQDLLLPSARIAPAVAFYLMFPAGLLAFAIAPALRLNSARHALIHGGVFGLMTYGTYDLTNFATLRNWTLELTVIDIAYGAAVSALISFLCYRFIQRSFR